MLALLLRAALAALVQQPAAEQAAAGDSRPAQVESFLNLLGSRQALAGQPGDIRSLTRLAFLQADGRSPNQLSVANLAFSPDGSRLAASDGRGTVRLYDTTTGREILSLPFALNNITGNLTFTSADSGSNTPATGADGVAARLYDQLVTALPSAYVRMGSEDDGVGATLSELDPALRVQLKLGEKCQGVAVTNVVPGGPSERAGLKVNDILLSLGDHPINAPGELATHLKDIGGQSAVDLRIIREGKTQTISVKPQYRVTLAPAEPPKPRYYIGVQAAPVADLIRVHLKLPEGQGLALNDVIDDSPAKRAGLKTGDILLELDGKPLTDVETLTAQVQAVADKTAPLKLIREGKETQILISPAPRAAEETGQGNLYYFVSGAATDGWNRLAWTPQVGQFALRNLGIEPDSKQWQATVQPMAAWYVAADPATSKGLVWLNRVQDAGAALPAVVPAKTLEELTREVEELKRSVDELRKSVDANRK
jgi:membrane-associated protease RseP (regulator of RpoE activity)